MPIKVVCQCNQALQAPDSLAGKTAKCPKCKQSVKIPAPKPLTATPSQAENLPRPSLLDELEGATGPQCPACFRPLPQNQLVCPGCGFNRQQGMALQQNPGHFATASAYTSSEPARPKKKKKKKKSSWLAEPIFSFDGGKVLAGIGMMLGATVWFVLGLMAGRIFFYPPVLFIFGVISLINGILGGGDD